MKRTVLAVFDKRLDCYMQPIFLRNTAEGVRIFADQINNNEPDNNLRKHPEDFKLVHLATFDDETGTFQQPEEPFSINALDLKRAEENVTMLDEIRKPLGRKTN